MRRSFAGRLDLDLSGGLPARQVERELTGSAAKVATGWPLTACNVSPSRGPDRARPAATSVGAQTGDLLSLATAFFHVRHLVGRLSACCRRSPRLRSS